MIISSPSRFIGIDHPGQGIINITKGGFESVSLDFSMGYSPGVLEYYGKEKKKSRDFGDIWKLLERAAYQMLQGGLHIPIATAPYLQANTKRKDLNDLLRKLTENCIDLCGKIGCEYIVIPQLFSGIKKADTWTYNHDYYMELGKIALRYNITILLSNKFSDFNGHLVRGICSNPYEAAEWIDSLNAEIGSECFGFCMDTGVCNICGQNMYDFAVILGSRIKAVVLRDNNGLTDSSQMPFTCTYKGQPQTDWLNLIRGLRKICFDGQLIIDYTDSLVGFPMQLHRQYIRLAHELGDYMKWQLEIEAVLGKYDKRVLFGAGNMCRNYMKCYGSQYPPLFTCDNDKNMWGKVFEGLEVKDPQALKSLPSDCAVFICNTYYSEIKKQLSQMGISNPIEYFNDEYMPSFYFDRIDVSERKAR